MTTTLDKVFAPQVALRIYGLAAVAFGLVGLVWGDFAAVWQPVPETVPGRTALAYAVAAVLLLAGLGVQWRRSAATSALTLAILYSLGVILLHVPSVIAHPSVFVMWSGTAEQLALVAGGMVAYAFCAEPAAPTADRLVRIGRLLFGVCLIVFGLAHLFYLKATADFVPAWLPRGSCSGPTPLQPDTLRPALRFFPGLRRGSRPCCLPPCSSVSAFSCTLPTSFTIPTRILTGRRMR